MSVPGPTLGPCDAWLDGADVAACCDVEATSEQRDMAAVEASMALFEASGRQYPGLCTATVRPCRAACSCWGPLQLGGWWWDAGLWWAGGYGGWVNGCGDRCGCHAVSEVRLAGYPVREITEVKIDGAVVDPATYRLDRWRLLVRLDDPGPPVVKRTWPGCQSLSLPDTEPGTWSVEYRWGVDPPPGGVRAAAELACELLRACSGAECKLPAGVTRVSRQGVDFDREVLANWLDPTRTTGFAAVDLFLRAYGRKGRRPAIWSPDTAKFPRRMTS